MRGITLYCKWVDSFGMFNAVWINFSSLRNPCWLLFRTGLSLVCCSFFDYSSISVCMAHAFWIQATGVVLLSAWGKFGVIA
jgi:hypothetical protein